MDGRPRDGDGAGEPAPAPPGEPADADEGAGRGEEEARERARAAERFREHTRDPLRAGGAGEGEDAEDGGDGPAVLAAAAAARRTGRRLFEAGRDLNTIDRSYISSAHIGDIHLRLDAHRPGTRMRSGPVPEEELRGLRRLHVEPEGYVRLREALRTRRLLVLGAAPGTGRTMTALCLLDEVTAGAAGGGTPTGSGARVHRADPEHGVRGLVELLGDADDAGDPDAPRTSGTAPGRGYLVELPPAGPGSAPPDALDLDGLAASLAGRRAFAVIVVTIGSAANALMAGRYGMTCLPVPTRELLTARLRDRLREHVPPAAGSGTGDGARPDPGELLASALARADAEEVGNAIGLEDLRPAEVEVLASLLAGRVTGAITDEELLAGCRDLAARQAREWFTGVDRGSAVPRTGAERGVVGPSAASLFHPVAFRLALAVLGGVPYGVVASAAHLLTWELSVQADPDTTPARPLFCDDPDTDLVLARADLRRGRTEVAGAEVEAGLVWYRGAALPSAVLAEVWDRHFPVRAPMVRWLRLLADDPRPGVWMRAAVAAGELCVRDFDHGHGELIRPLARARATRRRFFAATAMDQVAGHPSHRPAVHKLVDDWSRSESAALRWTAAMTLGYGNAAPGTEEALDALARTGTRGEGAGVAVASFNTVRLMASSEAGKVMERVAAWVRHRREEYRDLGLVTVVRFAATEVNEVLAEGPDSPLGERRDQPLPLALAAVHPGLVPVMAAPLRVALDTPRSRDAALDALESLLRSAVRADGMERTRPGLAELLPHLVREKHELQRLDWLLRRMMNDRDDPLPEDRARSLWWLAVPAGRGSPKGENHVR
ncbi:hypothetical protein [Streptomyces sp. ST2-7A]|uniref:hypothetical protein n=1 Tax=Streptomyces sp. ST2-7A TaxID=2907214 RepID=UPI001F392723|nr:hypothetical protein [Streptomyces sp. ST2-7A]MCE7082181.1 hypothetical protein [Streptomyces sp. ST2-7A]